MKIFRLLKGFSDTLLASFKTVSRENSITFFTTHKGTHYKEVIKNGVVKAFLNDKDITGSPLHKKLKKEFAEDINKAMGILDEAMDKLNENIKQAFG